MLRLRRTVSSAILILLLLDSYKKFTLFGFSLSVRHDIQNLVPICALPLCLFSPPQAPLPFFCSHFLLNFQLFNSSSSSALSVPAFRMKRNNIRTKNRSPFSLTILFIPSLPISHLICFSLLELCFSLLLSSSVIQLYIHYFYIIHVLNSQQLAIENSSQIPAFFSSLHSSPLPSPFPLISYTINIHTYVVGADEITIIIIPHYSAVAFPHLSALQSTLSARYFCRATAILFSHPSYCCCCCCPFSSFLRHPAAPSNPFSTGYQPPL